MMKELNCTSALNILNLFFCPHKDEDLKEILALWEVDFGMNSELIKNIP